MKQISFDSNDKYVCPTVLCVFYKLCIVSFLCFWLNDATFICDFSPSKRNKKNIIWPANKLLTCRCDKLLWDTNPLRFVIKMVNAVGIKISVTISVHKHDIRFYNLTFVIFGRFLQRNTNTIGQMNDIIFPT